MPGMPNHAVTIVGWDDSFPRSRFLSIPVDWEGNPFPAYDISYPEVASHVTHKNIKKPPILKVGKHTRVPFQCNVEVNPDF